MSNQDLKKQIEILKAENAALNSKLTTVKAQGITLKVSQKGGVSLYGMGRFPVTLYKSQWEKLLANAETIAKFIGTHSDKLKEKEAA